jgi:hypothetical protein
MSLEGHAFYKIIIGCINFGRDPIVAPTRANTYTFMIWRLDSVPGADERKPLKA